MHYFVAVLGAYVLQPNKILNEKGLNLPAEMVMPALLMGTVLVQQSSWYQTTFHVLFIVMNEGMAMIQVSSKRNLPISNNID